MQFPKATEFNKRIPKEKFYENLNVSPALKKSFVDQIKVIYWRNKIAATTTNLADGSTVTEIEVFEIRLKASTLDEDVLHRIDTEIPYHILFLLEFGGKYQAWIGYKEAAASGNNAFKVTGYYHTEWMSADELPLRIEGLNLDTAYESFVRQIAGEKLASVSEESLKDAVQRDEQKKKLQKQIDALQAKIRKEKQLNRQMEMNAQIKELRAQYKKL